MRVLSLANYNEGRWHVRAEWFGHDCVVFDTEPGMDELWQIADCLQFVRDNTSDDS